MKFLIVCVLAAFAISAHALTDADKQILKDAIPACLASTDVDKDLIPKARTSEYTGRDPKLAAYYTCMLGKMDFQQADGQFNIDRMIEKLPAQADKELSTKAVKMCAVFDSALSKDENSMNYIYCFYKTVGKDFKLV